MQDVYWESKKAKNGDFYLFAEYLIFFESAFVGVEVYSIIFKAANLWTDVNVPLDYKSNLHFALT